MYNAVVVRTRKGVRRPDGPVIRFRQQCGCGLTTTNSQSVPVFFRLTREPRNEQFMKIVSLAPEVL